MKNKRFAAAVMGLAAVILTAGIFMYLAWRSYGEKMEILYVVVEQQGEGKEIFETVTALLKGQTGTDTGGAEKKLERYGYLGSFRNQYKKSLYQSWECIAAVLGLLYTGFLLSLYLDKKESAKKRREELLWLQDIIAGMRDDIAEYLSGKKDGNRKSGGNLKARDEDWSCLMMALEALADSLSLLGRRGKRRDKSACDRYFPSAKDPGCGIENKL